MRSASSQRFEVPRTKLKFGEQSFFFAGPTAWNAMFNEIQILSNTANLKIQLKTYPFQQAFSYISVGIVGGFNPLSSFLNPPSSCSKNMLGGQCQPTQMLKVMTTLTRPVTTCSMFFINVTVYPAKKNCASR